MTTKRPFLLHVLAVVFLLGAAASLVGTIGLFKAWTWWLAFIPLSLVMVQVFMGVLIALAWIIAAIILWLRLKWAVLYSGFVALLSLFWFWVDRIILTSNPLPFSRHLLSLAITLLFTLFVFCGLYLVAPFMTSVPSSKSDGISNPIQQTGEKI